MNVKPRESLQMVAGSELISPVYAEVSRFVMILISEGDRKRRSGYSKLAHAAFVGFLESEMKI